VPRSRSLNLSPTSSTAPAGPSSGSLIERVRRVIELIRPAVQADGGDIEFVGLTPDNLVQIRMHGACVGCPSSTVTLQTGIERNLKAHIPEIKGIQALES
jgi:Fe-S cluster biogenesis protein NfuA